MKTFLHVGCGSKRKESTTKGFNTPEWNELRLDINSRVLPDIVGSITDMSGVPDHSVDAIYSSHNIEHLYPHEVPLALAEFKRVLKPDGFLVITCPDLRSICALIAKGKLTEPVYTSPSGPITPLDILYGHRGQLARGDLYMAHHCGFTSKSLRETMKTAGFISGGIRTRSHPNYDIWAVAALVPKKDEDLNRLISVHFPKKIKS